MTSRFNFKCMYKRLARLTILVISLLTLGSFYFIAQLRFDYNFEKFFPLGNPDLEYYIQYRETFENDNDYLLISLLHPPSVFDQEFLLRADTLAKKLRQIPDVVQVLSPTELKRPARTPVGWLEFPLLHLEKPEQLTNDSSRIMQDSRLMGNFFAPNGHSIALVLKHTQMIPKDRADVLSRNVEETIETLGFDNYHIAGKAKAQGTYVTRLQKEFAIFLGMSLVLVIIFLSLAYRALWAVIVPLCVVMLSVIWMLAIMGMFNKPLDIMLVLMPTILFVVGMSDVVHILSKYIEELRKGRNKLTALKTAFREVGLATLLTSVTTAIGFLSLYTASIQPIREFGLFTAAGVFIAFLLAFSLLPAVLIFLPRPKVTFDQKYQHKWQNFLRQAYSFVFFNRRLILLISAVLTFLSLYGISRIEINTYLLEDIPREDPLKQDFIFFDQNYGGARPFEMAVWVKDSSASLYDPKILHELDKIEHYLNQQYDAQNLISPVFLIKSLHQAYKGGLPEQYRLPQKPETIEKLRRLLSRLEKSQMASKVATKDQRYGRFSGRMEDIGSKISLERNEELADFMEQNVNLNLIGYRLTGTSLLIDKNNEYLAANMLEGLAIAFLVIALISGLLFRSLRMVLITLIPNIIPLLMVAGIMGIFGITLKLSTSIIFTIAFGIAVDDTIHFISKLRIELNKGYNIYNALKNTYYSTGKAIIITSIILSGGFMILILSAFGGTFYTGLLVSLTLVFALVIDLTLLPVLVLLFYKK
jgi:uncharacterized protein